jgi:hypothetical protein
VNKSKAQKIHAKRRFAERLGMSVGNKSLDEMVRKIKAGQGKFIKRQSLRVAIWELIVLDDDSIPRVVRVIYDRQRSNIVTVLPQKV